MILGDIMKRNAKRYPEKTGLVFKSVRFNFGELNRRINSMANALTDLGMHRGDRAAILLDNCPEFVELYFAIPKAGGVAVPLNLALSGQEMAYIINNAQANILVFGERFASLVNSLRNELSSVKNLVVVGAHGNEMKSYEQLIARYPAAEPEVPVGEEELAYLLYTSGTTGVPKGVMVTHRGMIEGALNYVLGYRLQPRDIGLLTIPLFWGGSLFPFLMPHFYLGCTVVLSDDFTPEAILDLIQKERVTTSFMVPSLITALLEYPQLSNYDCSSLRHVWFGGEPMAVETLKRAIGAFGNVFFQLYGLVELTPVALIPPEEQVTEGPPEKVKRLASCGREACNVEVRVVDDEGRDVAPGQVGEVICRGDNMMKGYWGMPQATEEVLRGGYVHTGDMATVDEDGYLYLVGRKKDLIVSGGRNIYPAEVEEIIYQHPSIVEAAVIGVPDDKLGESIKAVVVAREGENITEGDIIDFCRQRLPDYAQLKSVTFVDKLPRNPSGKILRRILREKFQS